MIVLSGDYGSEDASEAIFPLHEALDRLFTKGMRRKYSSQIKEFFIMLRVSGRIANYREEGLGRVVHSKKHKQIGIGLGIPRGAWEGQTPASIKKHLVQGLRDCFAVLKSAAARKDPAADLIAWEADFERCLATFQMGVSKEQKTRKSASRKAAK